MKKMPKDWRPPVDAWQAEFTDEQHERVIAYFGVQFRVGADVGDFLDHFTPADSNSARPATMTRARHVDASGYENVCFITYWHSLTDYQQWWDGSGFGEWWAADSRLREAFGLWREVYAVTPARFETLFSSRNPTGIARLGNPFGEPLLEHNYWGGMRDRMRASSIDGDPLESSAETVEQAAELRSTRGARITVPVPENLCLIRSGQDYRACPPGELCDYLDIVHPNLVAGMAFLRDHPAESGCISCRFMDETHLDGTSAGQSFGLALFVSMTHLEEWARNHSSHLAIFNSFFRMIEKRQGNLQLRLWHEVLVTNSDGTTCEYVNCHPRTGLLPFFTGRFVHPEN